MVDFPDKAKGMATVTIKRGNDQVFLKDYQNLGLVRGFEQVSGQDTAVSIRLWRTVVWNESKAAGSLVSAWSGFYATLGWVADVHNIILHICIFLFTGVIRLQIWVNIPWIRWDRVCMLNSVISFFSYVEQSIEEYFNYEQPNEEQCPNEEQLSEEQQPGEDQ